MKKSIYAIAASIALTLSGCSIYTAPWDQEAYQKAPAFKEAKVYQDIQPSVNMSKENKAPVLDSKSNINKETKVTSYKKATVVKEKVINVPVSNKSTVPNVSQATKLVEKPVQKNVMLIPIE